MLLHLQKFDQASLLINYPVPIFEQVYVLRSSIAYQSAKVIQTGKELYSNRRSSRCRSNMSTKRRKNKSVKVPERDAQTTSVSPTSTHSPDHPDTNTDKRRFTATSNGERDFKRQRETAQQSSPASTTTSNTSSSSVATTPNMMVNV
uniref:Uncharacterized protein n=1 Tax=Heterorhabditis bacteriophora TaxID=37862 RepID=A0A1I7X846_HETBA